MTAASTEAMVHSSAVIDDGVVLGRGTQVWHFSHICSGAQLGQGCKLGQNVFVGKDVRIGHRVKIQNNVSVYAGVTLEDDVFCGPSAVFTNVKDPRSAFPKDPAEGFLTTRVGRGATIGANATIICGVQIGEQSFIGAGSVVTRDVPAYALVIGNPARVRGWMCACGQRLSLPLESASASGECSRCQRRYQRQGQQLTLLTAPADLPATA